MWDLWWTKWRWGRFSPGTSVTPANSHSIYCSTIIIIISQPGLVQQASSGRSTKWTHSQPTNHFISTALFSVIVCSREHRKYEKQKWIVIYKHHKQHAT
jgi:hypothetical protein